jgi:carboxymethylenebutenolidase
MIRSYPASRAVQFARFAGLLIVSCLLPAAPAAAQEAAEKTNPIGIKGDFDSATKKISVWRYEPSTTGKYPAVVMLHGCDGWEQMKAYEWAAQGLVKAGHVVLLIRYYDRTGTTDKVPDAQRNAFVRWLKEGAAPGAKDEARDHFDQWIETVADAVKYARTMPNVDAKRIGIVGFSLGGYLAMSAAPRCNVGAVVEMFGGVPKEKHETLNGMPPAFIVHGDKDTVVSVDEAYLACGLVRAQNQLAEIRILKGVGHAGLIPGTEIPNVLMLSQARSSMTDFFRTHLSDRSIALAGQ